MRRLALTAVSLITLLLTAATLPAVPAEGTDVDYRDGDAELQGYVARPLTRDLARRPALLIVHNWMGLKEYEKMRARMVAELGYVAFAVDVYGKGVRPRTVDEAREQAGKFRANRELYRSRLKAALDTLKARPDVDPARIAIAGYCFGGTGALELARSGAELAGAVSFHGGLGTGNPEEARNIKASLLVLHGAIDPHVPETEVDAFLKEMNEARVDYQLVYYSGAVHAFTEKEAGDDPAKGAAYDAAADARSWKLFTSFLEEIFSRQEGQAVQE
jgi:dienelactone hydrolase